MKLPVSFSRHRRSRCWRLRDVTIELAIMQQVHRVLVSGMTRHSTILVPDDGAPEIIDSCQVELMITGQLRCCLLNCPFLDNPRSFQSFVLPYLELLCHRLHEIQFRSVFRSLRLLRHSRPLPLSKITLIILYFYHFLSNI
jgi:hypothetical protein